jgi:hypothetical protein
VKQATQAVFEEEPTALLSVEHLRKLMIFSVELKVGAALTQVPTGAKAKKIVTQLKKELFVRVPTMRWASENPVSKWYKPGAVQNPSDLDRVAAWAPPQGKGFSHNSSIKKREASAECLRIANSAIKKARR